MLNLRFAFSGAFVALCCSASLADLFGDTFLDTATQKDFYLLGVPDFDQRRHATTVTINGVDEILLGLAGDGDEYCVPTSCIDWTGFLANRGWPNLLPGPGDLSGSWTDGEAGRGVYNLVDLSIGILGAKMGTSSTNGTYGGPASDGAQEFIDAEYLGSFVTVNIEADSSGFPQMLDLLNASLQGNLIEPYGGWYNAVGYNGSTYYYRNGGHATAMASASWTSDSDSIQLGLCNPWTYDDKTIQSPYEYSAYNTTHQSVQFTDVDGSGNPIPGHQKTYTADWLDSGNNWLLDGALEIQPLAGYTRKHGLIQWLVPIQFANFHNIVNAFSSADESDIRSMARNPLTGLIYYITQQGGNTLYCLDPLSGETRYIPLRLFPRQILFGSNFALYALFGDGSVDKLDPHDGMVLDSFNFGSPIDQLVFDPGRNFFAGLDVGHRRYFLMDQNMHGMGQRPLFSLPHGDGPVTFQFGGAGHLFMFQHGDPNLYEIWSNTSLSGGGVTHHLPAVQDAATFGTDDFGKFYFSLNGLISTFDKNGRPVNSPFNGLPAGDELQLTRNVSNYDPSIHGTWQWRNTVPEGVFGIAH